VRVLFLCTGNSARSQIAEALLREAGGARVEVASAGTDPQGVHPLTVEVLGEVGIDVRGAVSEHLDRYVDQRWDYVITVCDRAAESCPTFPGAAERLHWSIADPAAAAGSDDARLAAFRGALDDLRRRVEGLIEGHLPGPSQAANGGV
jgi:arsenate reductase